MAAIKDPLKQELKLRTLLLTAYTTFVVFFMVIGMELAFLTTKIFIYRFYTIGNV